MDESSTRKLGFLDRYLTGNEIVLSRSKDVGALVKSLSARPDVVFVEPNFIALARRVGA